jgi:hypothetical protein
VTTSGDMLYSFIQSSNATTWPHRGDVVDHRRSTLVRSSARQPPRRDCSVMIPDDLHPPHQ